MLVQGLEPPVVSHRVASAFSSACTCNDILSHFECRYILNPPYLMVGILMISYQLTSLFDVLSPFFLHLQTFSFSLLWKQLNACDKRFDQNDKDADEDEKFTPCRIGVFGFSKSAFVAAAACPTHQLRAVVLKRKFSLFLSLNSCNTFSLNFRNYISPTV